MSSYFITILNMSLTASYVALGVIIARLLLKKAPKIFSYALWAVVLFRLISPFSFESSFSLMPGKTEAISQDIIIYSQNPAITTGIGMVDKVANKSIEFSLPPANPWESVNPMGIVIEIAAFIWILGIALLLSYGMVSYLRLKHRLSTATLVNENIYETDRIKTPFVLGFVKPRIYIPTELSESELDYILKHEQTHIRRFDYMIKPVAFIALVLHWFNPLIWLSYFLMIKDMEMSCDESVMKQSNSDIRANYANSLLSLSAKHSGLLSPLAFGESSLKSRIKNVLNYKKPAFWVIIAAIAAVLVVSVGFMANPKEKDESLTNAARLLDYKTEYVGNASKVGNIISSMNYPNKVNYDHFELHTANIPYGITVYLKTEEAIRAEVIRQELEKSAIVMFSLIDNVDFIRYAIWLDDEDHLFIFTREQANERMGQDVRGFAQGEEEFTDLLRMLKSVSTVEDADKQIGAYIEKNLSIILSSPNISSNPGDYIKAHQDEYEAIIKYGDDALNYLLQQFETGDNNDLRGHIMMILSKELLGDRNNVTDETLLPQEWYSQLSALSIREEVKLPNFVYEGNNLIEKLVYDTEVEQNINPNQSGFVVVAPKIHAYYEEGNKLKVFVTTFYANYHLYDKVLSQDSAGVVPAAITYIKRSDGGYALEKYEQAMDGVYWSKSIKDYCTLPVSGEKIDGLPEKIVNHYGNYDDLKTLMKENLIKHLKAHNQTGVNLKMPAGDIIPLT